MAQYFNISMLNLGLVSFDLYEMEGNIALIHIKFKDIAPSHISNNFDVNIK